MNRRRSLRCRLGLLLLLALASVPVRAQGPDRAKQAGALPGLGSQFLRELEAKLNLTDAQKKQVHRLKKDFQAKHKDQLHQLRQQTQQVRQTLQRARQIGDRAALKAAQAQAQQLRREAERLRSEFERRLLEVLTAEQKKQYQALQIDLSHKRR